MATRAIEIATKIREGVLNGDYPGGMRMNEVDLATALGVSRTPVRNALSTLGAEGLLDYTPNSGYVVRTYSSRDISDIYDVRAVLDGLAAKTLAEQGLSDACRGVLHKLITDGADLVARRRWSDQVCSRWIAINEAFHATLIDATDNAHLRAMFRKAKDIPLVNELRFRWFDGNDMSQSQSEHSEIFHAIVNKQAVRAEALTREHTYRSGRRIVEHWRELEIKRRDIHRDVA
ncbi:GntR family transcriptional regulator [Afipia sp. P52-10]|uniref:GntR family transcriptional regulator n=1 Tax=Afipia sp. P52-10 TaxID=1429916 RepID=UPI0009DCC4DF|nr:GntR family transcriptional regulator [Afipia sp. P52-10]